MKALIAGLLGWMLTASSMVGAATAIAAIGSVDEISFLSQNEQAMVRMMRGMSAQPTGDIDKDFVALMVPHHQGAIDMAMTMLRYGHNAQLKRLAQEIIVTQQQEIVAMKLAVGEPLPPSKAAPTSPSRPAEHQSALSSRQEPTLLVASAPETKAYAIREGGP